MQGQLSTKDIHLISITDESNINYERIITLDFEIRFNGSIELWHTKKISRNEFHFNRTEAIINNQNLPKDSVKNLIDRETKNLEDRYLYYMDTVKAQKIKTLHSKEIDNLLKAILTPKVDKEAFLSIINLESYSSESQVKLNKELNESHNLTYFPLLGVTIFLKNGEKIIFYCDSQSKIAIPWNMRTEAKKNYNPEINWALYQILPDELTQNKSRLSRDLKDLRKKIAELVKK